MRGDWRGGWSRLRKGNRRVGRKGMGRARIRRTAKLRVRAGARGGVGCGRINRIRGTRSHRRGLRTHRHEWGLGGGDRVIENVESTDEDAWTERSNKARRDFLNDLLARGTRQSADTYRMILHALKNNACPIFALPQALGLVDTGCNALHGGHGAPNERLFRVISGRIK